MYEYGYGGGMPMPRPPQGMDYGYSYNSSMNTSMPDLGKLEGMIMGRMQSDRQRELKEQARYDNNMNHWGSPFAPVRMPSAGQVGGRANWVAGQLEGQNYAQQLKATQTGGGASASGYGGSGGGSGGGAGLSDLLAIYKMKMDANAQAMGWADNERNRAHQAELQRRGFMDSEYNDRRDLYQGYGLSYGGGYGY
jgi:hypothetical protein